MFKTISLSAPDAYRRSQWRWTPAHFLFVGGLTLTVLGLSGVAGILRSLSLADLLNTPHWINWLHLSVGTAAVIVALKGNARIQRGMAFVPAVLGSILGIGGLVLSFYALANNRREPLDLSEPLAHVCVGVLASWAVWNTRSRTT